MYIAILTWDGRPTAGGEQFNTAKSEEWRTYDGRMDGQTGTPLPCLALLISLLQARAVGMSARFLAKGRPETASIHFSRNQP